MNYFNNPFNIRSGSNWEGLVGSSHGFCEFKSIPYAVRCFIYLVKNTYVRRLGKDYTIEQFFKVYCPPGDGNNDPVRYVNLVVDFMRDNAYLVSYKSCPARFSRAYLYCFANAVCRVESHYHLEWNDFLEGYKLYK